MNGVFLGLAGLLIGKPRPSLLFTWINPISNKKSFKCVQFTNYTKSYILDHCLYKTTVLIHEDHRFVYQDPLGSWQNHPNGKQVLIARPVALPTQTAILCHAIRPPCCAKEPSPPEASSCKDNDFKPNIRRLKQLEVLLHYKVVYLHHNFVILSSNLTAFQQNIQISP